ncbi:hypothetical protein GCM10010168_68320 [Actinoplanes ianthinogenes]|uniref:Uncharacterized protein n=1 Tax=Actinoplanes ianthinogenes TaxID=122358 RepID=A0ABM7LXJ6_9ACTN|nr:hypothetical protein Aiant_46860 [Actinoplanes ianthinogenes]GGR39876.1 hypothetical protein GCM10010168_68320 [Actinoplanes ianthinogenes]
MDVETAEAQVNRHLHRLFQVVSCDRWICPEAPGTGRGGRRHVPPAARAPATFLADPRGNPPDAPLTDPCGNPARRALCGPARRRARRLAADPRDDAPARAIPSP